MQQKKKKIFKSNQCLGYRGNNNNYHVNNFTHMHARMCIYKKNNTQILLPFHNLRFHVNTSMVMWLLHKSSCTTRDEILKY